MFTSENIAILQGDLSKSEIEAVCKLLSKTFKFKFTFEYLDWLYNKNPNGKALVYNAYNNKNIIGHYCLVPILLFDNRTSSFKKSLLSLHTAIDEDFRGKNLFIKLAKLSFEQALNEGYHYIFGISNSNSTHGFVKYLDFKIISPLESKVGYFNLKNNYKNDYFKIYWEEKSISWRFSKPKVKYFFGKNIFRFFKFFKISYVEDYDNRKSSVLNSLFPELYIGLNNKKIKFGFPIPNFL